MIMFTTVATVFAILYTIVNVSDWNAWCKKNKNDKRARIFWLPIRILSIISVPLLLIMACIGIAGAASAIKDIFTHR